MLAKNLDFGQKSKFWAKKIKILAKNRNFRQKSEFFFADKHLSITSLVFAKTTDTRLVHIFQTMVAAVADLILSIFLTISFRAEEAKKCTKKYHVVTMFLSR